MKSSVFLLSTAEDCAIIKNVRKRVKQSKMRLLISCRGTKGPPDGPPIFLIFVKPLKWPQSQAYQSFLTFRSRFTLVGWAFWMSFIDLHRELDSTRCPEIGKTQNPLVATPCGFKSHHRHHVGMDYAPFKKPSRLAGLFSYRSVIPPFPHKTLLCKLSWGPRPTGQGGEQASISSRKRMASVLIAFEKL